jgi:hypothetical protein
LSAEALPAKLLWPAAGLALIALGWWQSRHGGGWGALLAAATACAFARAAQIEKSAVQATLPAWLFSRRNAILAALIFALAGAWTSYLVALLVYAAVSFFVVQFIVHRIRSELTAH